jgi:aryl-alcohol dehydrogenase-like predicted oxidoreductase
MLGRTGIEVSTFCLGTMMFGAWGDTDEATCTKMVDLALARRRPRLNVRWRGCPTTP